jgi:hypothetical protein
MFFHDLGIGSEGHIMLDSHIEDVPLLGLEGTCALVMMKKMVSSSYRGVPPGTKQWRIVGRMRFSLAMTAVL